MDNDAGGGSTIAQTAEDEALQSGPDNGGHKRVRIPFCQLSASSEPEVVVHSLVLMTSQGKQSGDQLGESGALGSTDSKATSGKVGAHGRGPDGGEGAVVVGGASDGSIRSWRLGPEDMYHVGGL